MVKRTPNLKRLALTCLAVVVMVSLSGCVASRKEVYHLKNRTSEIQDDLDRLEREIEERLRFVGRPDGKYDYNNSLLIDTRVFDEVLHSIVTIQTATLFEAGQSSQRVVKNSRGIGVVVGRHILTLDHVVTQNSLEVATPFGTVSLPSKKLEEKTFLVSRDRKLVLKKVLGDPELDIALFEVPANDLNLASLPSPVGNSDELTVGTFLYIAGNPFNSGINVREGIVSSLLGLEGIQKISNRRSDLFVISNGVVPGDSGAPVLALRDGVPELVGIVQGTLGSSRIGWAVKINPIMRGLSKNLDREELYMVQKENPPLY